MTAYRDTTLTPASLRNGRIYFSASDAPFAIGRLGDRSVGDRSGKEPGTPVEIHLHGGTLTTDIRQASGVCIGPRTFLASWFRAIRRKARRCGSRASTIGVSNSTISADRAGN